ncbi:MAG: PDZ domain-containing protein [bacterium]|nr:PDZ domain-containing protein [bacterium]
MYPRIALYVLTALLAYPVLADNLLHLPIGDPARSDREVPLALDAITDAHSGELLTPAELPARLEEVDILLVGESHTSVDFHRVQYRVLDELSRAGRKVMIGLEMFPYTYQEHLDSWVSGHYSEQGFLEIAEWYEAWGYHWDYYRDLFVLARDRGMPMFAVNTPREVITAVREKGFQDLTEEEAAHIPSDIDTGSEEHLRLFKAYFDEDDPIHSQMSEDAWKSMLRAQCTWDATMGYNSIKAFQARREEGAILVVLAGSGHVSYGLGIERQAAQWFDGEVASLIPVPVRGEDDEPVASVQGSYADFLWGIPEDTGPIYPSLGISTRKTDDDRRQVIHVAEGTPAESAGFAVGDLLVAADGVAIDTRGAFNRVMATKRWGDPISVTVEREGENVTIEAVLRRTVETGEKGDDE